MTSGNHDSSLRYKHFILSIKCVRAKERQKGRTTIAASREGITRNFRNM